MRGLDKKAKQTLLRLFPSDAVEQQINDIRQNLQNDARNATLPIRELLHPALRLVLIVGFVLAVLQQITGINAVFFYAPTIFEQSGIGADAAFMQAILVGLTNIVFTIVAMLLIDRLGRRPLLIGGMAGIALSMMILAYGFGSASYELSEERLTPLALAPEVMTLLAPLESEVFSSDTRLRAALANALGEDMARDLDAELITATITINPRLILFAILAFVASFAVSIGPVMWVMFSELFPLRVKGLAISLAGFLNSATSFLVQLLFPVQLAALGSSLTFLIYGLFAIFGLIFVWQVVPETRRQSLEALEVRLTRAPS